ncbi:rhomboid domain-containing protein 2 [Discoglossus pictus]
MDQEHGGSWWKGLRAWLPRVELTPGVALTVLLSVLISLTAPRGADPWDRLDLEAGVLGSMTVHRLITYIYFHDRMSSLVTSCLIIWYFGGGFEESIGTVKFCFLTPLFAVSSGLVYLAILATGFNPQVDGSVQGFTAVALSMLCVFTTRTNIRRLMFFGFMVPTKVLPLLFLALATFIPHAPVLSNVCGILVGTMYGMGGCFFLDLPETLMSRMDQIFLFKLLKRIPVCNYIPASSAERNAAQNRKINPPPGSYPTQQYYTPPPDLQDSYNPYKSPRSAATWPPGVPAGTSPPGPPPGTWPSDPTSTTWAPGPPAGTWPQGPPAGTWPQGPPAGPTPHPVQAVPGTLHQMGHVCSGGHSHTYTHSATSALGASFPPSEELMQVQTQ